MADLTSTQRTILTAAAERENGQADFSGIKGGGARKCIDSLFNKGLIWHCADTNAYHLTLAGRAAIGAAVPNETDAANEKAEASEAQADETLETNQAMPEEITPAADAPAADDKPSDNETGEAESDPTPEASDRDAPASEASDAEPVHPITILQSLWPAAKDDLLEHIQGVALDRGYDQATAIKAAEALDQLVEKADQPRHRQSQSNGTPRTPRADSKQHQVIEMLRRPGGATIAEISHAMNWQEHTTRALVTATIGRKLGHEIAREKVDGVSRYKIVEKSSETVEA